MKKSFSRRFSYSLERAEEVSGELGDYFHGGFCSGWQRSRFVFSGPADRAMDLVDNSEMEGARTLLHDRDAAAGLVLFAESTARLRRFFRYVLLMVRRTTTTVRSLGSHCTMFFYHPYPSYSLSFAARCVFLLVLMSRKIRSSRPSRRTVEILHLRRHC